jgi:hypothetical protein
MGAAWDLAAPLATRELRPVPHLFHHNAHSTLSSTSKKPRRNFHPIRANTNAIHHAARAFMAFIAGHQS